MDSLKKVVNQEFQNGKVDTNTILSAIRISYYYQRRDTLEALKYAKFAKEWSTKLHYPRGKELSYQSIGVIYNYQGKFKSSIQLVHKALNINKKLHNRKGIANSYANLGTSYMKLGQFDKALALNLKSIPIFKSVGDSLSLAQDYVVIAVNYYHDQRFKKSFNYFKQAQAYYKRHHILPHLAVIYNDLGVLLQTEGKINLSLSYQLKGEKIKKKIGDLNGLAFSYFNIGNIYKVKKDYRLALKYHFKAISIRKKLNNISDLSYSYYEVGSIYLDKRNFRKATNYAKLSYKLAKKSGSLINQKRDLYLKTRIYTFEGQYGKAYILNQKYHHIKDSLLNFSKSKKIAELTQAYEAKKKEQEINILRKSKSLQTIELKKAQISKLSLIIGSFLLLLVIIILTYEYQVKIKSEKTLQQKNVDLSKANQLIQQNERSMKFQANQLIKANEELSNKNEHLKIIDQNKNDFFNMAAHDLKNPLVGISSLTDLLKNNLTNDPKHLKKSLQMIKNSSDEMITLVSDLLEVNKVDSESMNLDIKNRKVWPVIDNAIQKYESIASSKELTLRPQYDSKDVTALFDQTALRQIVENLISNAIKYSEPGKQIWVSVSKKGNNLDINVRDQGPGIPFDEQNKLFQKFVKLSPRPTKGEHSSGLGLYITKKLVSAMNGKIYCISKPGDGATFHVLLPFNDTDS